MWRGNRPTDPDWAAALEPGGRFVVEAFVPDTDADGPRRNVSPHLREDGTVVLTATVRDDDATVQGQHIELRPDGGVRLRPWRIRYSTPTELDTMAASIGFELEHRWNDWDRSPMDDTSIRHVSVYRLPAPSTDDPTS